MRLFKTHTQGIQGDVALTRITELPDGFTPREPVNGMLIVAHSETGHNHVIDENTALLYDNPDNPLVSVLVVEKTANLVHLRDFNTHETVQFDHGIYRINRQREYTPKGLRAVAD